MNGGAFFLLLYFFMRIITLYLCCMALACTAMAQRNYVPATIFTSQNDSLKGFINFRDWFQAPKEIIFKESLSDATEKHFGPGELNGFRIGEPDMEYVSRKVSIDVTKDDITGETEAWQRTIQDTVVFLKRVVGGNYNLYEYIDMHAKAHYIYDGANTPARELELIKAFVRRPSGDGVFTDERYKTQLAELFADNRAAARKAESVRYEEKSLAKLFIAYNNAKDPATTQVADVKKRVKYPLSFGLMGGMSFNSYTFKGAAFWGYGPGKSNSSPIGGIWLNIPFGNAARNFSAVIELMYKQSKTSSTKINGDMTRYDFSYVQLNTMFRYTYPTKTGIKPYVNIGMGNGLAVKIAQNDFAYSDMPGDWRVSIAGPRKHEQSVIAGIGVMIYKLGAEIRYNNANGFSPYSSGRTTFNSVQVLARYSF